MRARHGRFWLAAILALTVALAGCGVAGSPGGASTGGTTSGGTSGTLPPACQGTTLGAVTAPVITLRGSAQDHDVGAPVGYVVEIQMDTQHVWHLGSVEPDGVVKAVGAQGVVVSGACVWDFQITRLGEATVTLVGGARCPLHTACPMYAVLAKFTIHGHA